DEPLTLKCPSLVMPSDSEGDEPLTLKRPSLVMPSDSEGDEPLTLKRPSLVMPSDSEDDEPVTVLVSPVQDPPSVATRPDLTRYVAHKKMSSHASSDSEGKGKGNCFFTAHQH
ncbi:hypothetical protein CAPTEDRAFT_208256, partial [Capitella teleta]